MDKTYRSINANLLLVMLITGSVGASFIAPLREQFQNVTGLSRSVLGLGIFSVGLFASITGVTASRLLEKILSRVQMVKIGIGLLLSGMLIFTLVQPAPGLPVYLVAGGWFLLTFGFVFAGISNAIAMDIWHDRQHTGVILFHGTNAVGKVAAPLIVFLVGTRLSSVSLIYTVSLALVFLHAFMWPRQAVTNLTAQEHRMNTDGGPAVPAWKTGRFWLLAVLPGLIAGSETGAVSIMGSFIQVHRPSPLPTLSAADWAALVITAVQLGIVAGRFFFFYLSDRLTEKKIVYSCVSFAIFALPAVLAASPLVYLPSFFLLGLAFSATWPAYFTYAARRFPQNRTMFTMAVSLATSIGINGGIIFTSAIGNSDARLPLAILAGIAVMVVFILLFSFISRDGR